MSVGMNHPQMSPRSPLHTRDEEGILNSGNVSIPHGEHHAQGNNADQTTLLQNEEEGFALAPVDTTAVKGII